MFYYLDGTVAEILPYLAVIDCGGVGYACKTTNTTLAQLKKGQRGKLYTYLNVGEDVFDLYGFATQSELNTFKLLIGVSGVGPKAALSILSASTPANLALSIITGDEKALTCAQGIGKKIAQRVILELKDKMSLEDAFEKKSEHVQTLKISGNGQVRNDAVMALTALGYSSAESLKAVSAVEITEEMDVEAVLKAALKHMSLL